MIMCKLLIDPYDRKANLYKRNPHYQKGRKGEGCLVAESLGSVQLETENVIWFGQKLSLIDTMTPCITTLLQHPCLLLESRDLSFL